MYPSQSPPLNDEYRERDVVPLVAKKRPTTEEARSGGPARDLDAGSDQRIRTRRVEPSIRSPRPAGFKNDQVASARPSIGRRIFRTIARFFVAVLIGVGATLGWQSHGDEAKEMVRTRAPWLGWLLPVSTTETPAAAATSSELVQHLEPMARNLAVVRRSVEELAAKQEQMAQNIAILREVEQDIRQKMSWPPYGAVSIPPHTPSQPAAHPSGPQSSSVPPPPAARPPLLSR